MTVTPQPTSLVYPQTHQLSLLPYHHRRLHCYRNHCHRYLYPSISSTSNPPTLIKLPSLFISSTISFSKWQPSSGEAIFDPGSSLPLGQASPNPTSCSNQSSLVVGLHLADHDLSGHLHHRLYRLFSLFLPLFPMLAISRQLAGNMSRFSARKLSPVVFVSTTLRNQHVNDKSLTYCETGNFDTPQIFLR